MEDIVMLRRSVAALSLAALGVAGLVSVASGASSDACSTSTPAVCSSYDVSVTNATTDVAEHRAAAPADLTVSLDNTTSDLSDPSAWLATARLTMLSTGTKIGYTPSRQLADRLLLSGAPTDCGVPPDYTGCPDGHGLVDATVSGTGGPADGPHSGTFGIERVVNIQNPGGYNVAQWRMTLSVCLDINSTCNGGSPSVQKLNLVITKANDQWLTIPTSWTFDFDLGGQPAHADVSMRSLSGWRVHARSSTLGSGATLSSPETVVHLPVVCGRAIVSARTTSRGGASVDLPVTHLVSGCPTVTLSSQEPAAYQIRLAGAAKVGVSSRTVARYQWWFGDGRTLTTSRATVSHTYGQSGSSTDVSDHIVRVIVEDSAGAFSRAAHVLLKGTHLTASGPKNASEGELVRVSGRLTRWHTTHGLGGRTVKVLSCNGFNGQCDRVGTVMTSSATTTRGRYSTHVRLHSGYLVVLRYEGGGGYIGSVGEYIANVS